MSKRMRCELSQIVGTYEASLILGVERSRLAKWLTENEQGTDSIEPPAVRLPCGPIWTRDQIDRKLRALFLAEGRPGADGDDPDDEEAAFQEWAWKRQLARAGKENVAADRLQQIVKGSQLARAA